MNKSEKEERVATNPIFTWCKSFKKFVRQDILASRVGVSRRTIYSWLNGLSTPSDKHFEKLRKVTRGKVTKKKYKAWIEKQLKN